MKTGKINLKSVNLSKIKHVYFIGIGGISVSALAKYCMSLGVLVSGSDISQSSLTKELQSLGANIFIGHNKNNIKQALKQNKTKSFAAYYCKAAENIKRKDTNKEKSSKIKKTGTTKTVNIKNKKLNTKNKLKKAANKKINKNYKTKTILVVYSGAISKNNPELIYAESNNIVCLERSVFLGVVAKSFKNVISVSGTHGKTTTTALLGEIFIKAGLNPTIHLGGEVAKGYKNFLMGGNEIFITEACEYKKNFESLRSTYAVITNIEQDHMDSYQGLKDLHNSFNVFANNTQKFVIANIADKNKLKTKTPTIFCGTKNKHSNYYVKNIRLNKQGKQTFSVHNKNNKKVCNFTLNLTGAYNVNNALYAIALALQLNINIKTIKKALSEFSGIKRRNEFMGHINKLPVYADYAHHPTEIIESLKNYKKTHKNILLVFQPHTFSRTKTLFSEFKKCFKNANNLILFKTYPAREDYDFYGSETHLYNNVKFGKNKKSLCLNKENLLYKINENIKNNNAILFLGAGNLYDYINKILD